MSTELGSVTDWTTDFDLFDPRYVEDPASVWLELRERCPESRVLVLTLLEDDESVFLALRAGARLIVSLSTSGRE